MILLYELDFNPEDFLDKRTIENFKNARKRMENDWDHVNVIVGDEGSGKSVLGHLICLTVDKNMRADRIVFPTVELEWAISHAHEYYAVDHDEGAETWMSLDANSADGRKMMRKFMEIRYKRLFFNINIPDIQLLQRYMKKHRAKTLIRIIKRGTFAFYSKKRIKEIKSNKTTQIVQWPTPNYIGHWKQYPKTSRFWIEYAKKAAMFKGHKEENPKVIEQQLKTEKFLQKTVTLRDAAKMIGCSLGSLRTWHQRGLLKKEYGVKTFRTSDGRVRLLVSDAEKICKTWERRCKK